MNDMRLNTPFRRLLQSDNDGAVIDLGDVFTTLWRGKWIIVLIMLACLFVAGAYVFKFATPYFRSQSVIILEPQQNNIVDLESVVGGLSGGTEEVNSEAEVLRSRSLMSKVVNRLDLTKDPEFNSALRKKPTLGVWVDQLKGYVSDSVLLPAQDRQRVQFDKTVHALTEAISVRNIPRSYVFQITAKTQSPDKSAAIADALAQLYVLNQIEVKFQATEQATTWLSGRVSELQQQLETAEANVSTFSAATDLISAQALQAQEVQLKDTRDRLADAQASVVLVRARLLSLQAASSFAEKAGLAQDTQLNRLLVDIETNVDLSNAFDTRFEQIVARAELEQTRAQQQLNALQASIRTLEDLIETQGADLITLQQYTREADALRRLYEYFLTRLQETAAQEGIQQPDSRVLSAAVVPSTPSEPRKPLILTMAAMLGMMLGVVFVLGRESQKSGFRTAHDLEQFTGLNVLGQIPRIPAKKRDGVLQYLIDKPGSAAAEAYRNLRTSLMLSNVDAPPQVIVSTSCVPKEGKTTNSIALAQNLSGLGKRVLLIEGDIRRRTFGAYFGNLPQAGIVSVLSGASTAQDVILTDPMLNADILAGEAADMNAADLFASDGFKALIKDLRKTYDVILIDTPPVLVVPDARIIAECADALLFTVQWDQTSGAQLNEAMRMFETNARWVTGLVLSQIHSKRMRRYGYDKLYGPYAGYGAQYYAN